ncbi:MAG: class I SAM-dependent methyltransferase [Phycisphaerae bacterium]|nr:class I SAM-dependent methyltransferase [Phycisphaerae bacterium]
MLPPFQRPTLQQLPPISPDHTHVWYEYANAWLNFPLRRFLDYGCGSGGFLRYVAPRCDACHGVEIDREKVPVAAKIPRVSVQHIEPGRPLPFPDNTFDTICILEVIEHVDDERAVLAELARVLAPGGRLLLTTPHKGLLTFLDPGNFKFLAPAVHRFIHRTVLRQRSYYEKRFGDARRSEQGMIADFSVREEPWHRHYACEEILALAPSSLRLLAWTAYYPAFRALWTLRLAFQVCSFGLLRRLPPPFRWLAAALARRESRWGDQLVMMFEKTA